MATLAIASSAQAAENHTTSNMTASPAESSTSGSDLNSIATVTDSLLRIVQGEVVEECGWPTTLSVSGCTATLAHPRAITSAQHCPDPSQACFGTQGNKKCVPVGRCIKQGSADAKICELKEAVTDIPVTPILYGCELEKYRTVGRDVVISGFGMTTSSGGGSGTLRWAKQKITRVEAGMTVVGDAGVPPSPCKGDSGGPLYLQVDDGSWRVLGTVWKGTTSIECNSAANFQRPDQVVPAFEMATGIDITPCFDGQTGDWDPNEECGGFFAGSEKGSGTWANSCEGTPESGLSSQCGDPWPDDESSTGTSSDTGEDTEDTTGDDDDDSTETSESGEPSTGDDDDDNGDTNSDDDDDDSTDDDTDDDDTDDDDTDDDDTDDDDTDDDDDDDDVGVTNSADKNGTPQNPNSSKKSRSGCTIETAQSRSNTIFQLLFILLACSGIRGVSFRKSSDQRQI